VIEDWTIGGVVAALFAAVVAALRRRRRRRTAAGLRGPTFAPRGRFRAYLSLHTHENAPTGEIEIVDSGRPGPPSTTLFGDSTPPTKSRPLEFPGDDADTPPHGRRRPK
jgi:hypothetical protein